MSDGFVKTILANNGYVIEDAETAGFVSIIISGTGAVKTILNNTGFVE